MITNYANRRYQTVDVRVKRAWRPGLRNGQTVALSEPEAARIIRLGYAELPKIEAEAIPEEKPVVRKKRAVKKAD